MDAESAPISHNPIQQQRGRLRYAVVLYKELLELVNDQQRPRDRFRSARPLVARDVLHAELPEQVAAVLEFIIHPLQDAQAEFPVALNRHHARMREQVSRIALELHTLLEIRSEEHTS